MELINENLVRELIKEQFPKWSNLDIKPVKNMGHDNRTYTLGNEMSVRLPSGKDYALQAEKEQNWIPKLRENITTKIPQIIEKGKGNDKYPYCWSICSWIQGDTATRQNIIDMNKFAEDLANFLLELQAVNVQEGPIAGAHNFYRGGDIAFYDEEYRWLVDEVADYLNLDKELAMEIWQLALDSKWEKDGVWVHGDMAPTNVLVLDGKLEAVIDFGILGVGDPACDLAMYWTFFDKSSRKFFKEKIALDKETWDRARGWVIWKALFDINYYKNINDEKVDEWKRVLIELFNDYK